MRQQPPPPRYVPGLADAGSQIARLRHVLALVDELAGAAEDGSGDIALEEAARLSAAYESALPIDQKRFDALAGETARWAGAGVEALVRIEEAGLPTRGAAIRLAAELRRALTALGQRLPG